MSIALDRSEEIRFPHDCLSVASRSNIIDRWIYVFTAASFIAIVLTGFVPDSVGKVAAVQTGARPSFALVLHIHAVLMGSFLLLLLGQSTLVAFNKRAWHMRMGVAAAILVPAIIVSACVLAPTMYHLAWNAAQTAPTATARLLQNNVRRLDNILLLQMRTGLVFSICMWVALRARKSNPEIHKRLIFLAIATALPAAFDRMHWLPTTMPHHPLGADFYTVLAFSPMLLWDLTRNHILNRAYVIWAALFLPATATIYALWDKPCWHTTAHQIMGV